MLGVKTATLPKIYGGTSIALTHRLSTTESVVRLAVLIFLLTGVVLISGCVGLTSAQGPSNHLNPGSGSNQNPGTGSNQNPGTGSNQNPGTGSNQNPGSGSNQNPGSGSNQNPGTGSNQNPGSGSNQNPGSGSNQNPGSGSNQNPGSGSNQNPGTNAPAKISLSQTSVDFGSVAIGSAVSQSIMVSNDGDSNLIIQQASIAARGFMITDASFPMTIGAGKQSTINILFSPITAGAVSGTMSVMSNASNSPGSVSVRGTGVGATALLKINTISLNFGGVSIGAHSALDVTIRNDGNINLIVSSVKIQGAGFQTTGVPAGLILAPGQNATLDVDFSPTAVGRLTGSVTVASNATDSPAVISVSGTGAASGSHSVMLDWTPSTSPVVGYNVYRSTVTGGPYAKLNSSTMPDGPYRDSTVGANLTYFYVVRSVAFTGVESANSAEISVTIP
jgi:hypothetical protein